MESVRRTLLARDLLPWTVTFLAIPSAGYLGSAVVGPTDTIAVALTGGAIVGVIIGFAQALGSRRRLGLISWPLATAIGMSLGFALASFAVGYRTSLPDLALMGLINGAVLGIAQAIAFPARTRVRWLWAPVTAALWALGWTVTTLAGIAVDRQFIVFGASGAIVYAALSGLALHLLLPDRAAADAEPYGQTAAVGR